MADILDGLLEALTLGGAALDTPRAATWAALSGNDPAEALKFWDKKAVANRTTGWDLMKALGFEDTPGELDWVDVGAVGSEMLGDPLNLLFGAGMLKTAKAAKAAKKWHHASPVSSDVLQRGFIPKPGRMIDEPTASFFASTADDALSAAGRSMNPNMQVSEWSIKPRKIIDKNSSKYLSIQKEAEAKAINLYKDAIGEFDGEEAIGLLQESLSKTDPSHPGNVLTDLLRSRGYDAVRTKAGSEEWLMALDPSIIAPAIQRVPSRKPISAAAMLHNLMARQGQQP